MEPEIGFLMANLARVGPGSRVLDPFAGCCSLLLSAAFLQGMTPVEAGAIIPSRPHSHPLRDDLGDSWGASAPPKTPSSPSPSPTSADTDIYRACLVGVDACMGDDVSMIHSNFVAAGLGSHLASLTLRWDFAERLLQVLQVRTLPHESPATINL